MDNAFWTRSGKTSVRRLLVFGAVFLCACSPDYRDAGNYRIVTVTDGLFGLRCQPRTELYFLDSASPDSEPVYLGTCGTPRFVSQHLGMPHDPSCFAVSEGGGALVYFHRPKWCGAGETALRKQGGVYRHASEGGDRLLYAESQVGQIWSRAEIDQSAIRVGWRGVDPSPSGAVCSQNLVIYADGRETPEGEPRTVHGCPPPDVVDEAAENAAPGDEGNSRRRKPTS